MSFEEDNYSNLFNNVSASQLDDQLLLKLLGDNFDDKTLLLELEYREDFPKYVLNKDHLNDKRFDYLIGLTNIIRKLLLTSNEAVNKWIGLELVDETQFISLVGFIFEILDHCHLEPFLCPQIFPFNHGEIYLSVYEYLVSSICSFIITLDDEQISFIEDILLENLFSSSILKTLMASDILCFMCRASSKSYALDFAEILIKILEEIYFEDAMVISNKNEQAKSILCDHLLTIEICWNLFQRIFKFLNDEEIEKLLQNSSDSFQNLLWTRFDYKILNPNMIRLKNQISYEELTFQSKFNSNFQQQNKLISNILSFTEADYITLIHLRLLSNQTIRFLSIEVFSKLIQKISQILQSNENVYKMEISLTTLKLLNQTLTLINDEEYSNMEFIKDLYELLKILFNKCHLNYIGNVYYFLTLQNISSNCLFTKLIELFQQETNNNQIKTYFHFHLKYILEPNKLLIQDEKKFYIEEMNDVIMYKTNQNISMENMETDQQKQEQEDETCAEKFTFSHFDLSKLIDLKQETEQQDPVEEMIQISEDPNETETESIENLFLQLECLIDKINKIQFKSNDQYNGEKEKFLLLSKRLINILLSK